MAAEFVERMGERIRVRRDELGMSQEDVARAMPGRTNANQVSRWERGEHQPQPDSLDALSKVLRVPVAYFMMDEPDERPTPNLMDVSDDTPAGSLAQLHRKVDTLMEWVSALLAHAEGVEPPGDLVQTPPAAQPTDEQTEQEQKPQAADAPPDAG